MTPQEIQADRSTRVDACKAEVEKALKQYQFGLTAEDNWTPNTKVKIEISFVDLKKYDATVAEPATPKVPVSANGATATPTSATPIVTEGVQPDGSVVINPESLK